MNLNSLTWNWNFFGPLGYLGVILLWVVVALWVYCFALKVKPVFCLSAFALAVVAFGLVKINSLTYVNKIQLDPAAQKAAHEARQAAQRKAMLDSRGGEVAQIRFAEDAEGEFLDRAGMDETDLKYFDQQLSGAEDDTGEGENEPAWKKEKKTRTGIDPDDESDSDIVEAAEEAEPILMAEAEMMMANKLDAWVLAITKWFIFISGGIVIFDHIRRANLYREAYLPLPVPSAVTNSLNPYPPVVIRPGNPRRSIPQELAWILKRGDSFIYLTDDAVAADRAFSELQPLTAKKIKPAEILFSDSGESGTSFSDEFAFEVWWFGRASVIVGSDSRTKSLVQEVISRLEQRKDSRARVQQTAHLVWDLQKPMPEEWRDDFKRLAKRTGVSLFLCGPTSDHTEASNPSLPISEAPQLV